ncbi:MAG: hypothetical protein LQ346_003234 [Caloplaca aetnensis]|nr:MAG: hypothetical protein LQ346_003234 [Caloplaca aetnensis]
MVYGHFTHFRRGVVKAKGMSSRLRPFLVNRQFFTEASALFYASNVFRFYSAYVSRGDDPFGFNLTRIRKCFLHLNGTHPGAHNFITWFLKEFAGALVKGHSLEYLLVRVMPHQLRQVETLSALRGIDFVQIDVLGARNWPYHWQGLLAHSLRIRYYPWVEGPSELRLSQLLERLMMSDGSAAAEKKIRDRAVKAEARKEKYVVEPALLFHLRGEAARVAKSRGGWADPHALYGYLGVDPRRWLGQNLR